MSNYFARDGARALEDKIKAYWAARGYEVDIDLVPSDYDEKIRSVRYDVRSGMRNGMPQRRRA